jgi:ubiquinone/menaquinone biosynthesis C-methylase UbiE
MSSDFRLDSIIVQHIGNLNHQEFLDVACGQGKWGFAIKLGWSGNPKYSVGMDLWRQNLKFAKHHRIYDDLVLADARFLPFVDRSFGAVCACEFLLHVRKNEGYRVLKELERVSKKTIVVSVPNKVVKVGLDRENPFEKDLSGWSAKDLSERGYKVRGVGFQISGRRISRNVLAGLTFIPSLNRFAELIVGKKEISSQKCLSSP